MTYFLGEWMSYHHVTMQKSRPPFANMMHGDNLQICERFIIKEGGVGLLVICTLPTWA